MEEEKSRVSLWSKPLRLVSKVANNIHKVYYMIPGCYRELTPMKLASVGCFGGGGGECAQTEGKPRSGPGLTGRMVLGSGNASGGTVNRRVRSLETASGRYQPSPLCCLSLGISHSLRKSGRGSRNGTWTHTGTRSSIPSPSQPREWNKTGDGSETEQQYIHTVIHAHM